MRRCRRGEQRLAATGLLFEPGVAPVGERAVAGQVAARVGLGNVVELLAGHVRAIERNLVLHHVRQLSITKGLGMFGGGHDRAPDHAGQFPLSSNDQ